MVGEFKLNHAEAISEFEKILKKFNLKKKIYKLLFNTRGMEFEQFRDFDSSEDANAIDWGASVRANKLLSRQYIEEREINFFFVVDTSKNMLFGSKDKLKAEYAAEITLSLAHIIISSNDNAGLVMFNEKIIEYLPPKNIKKRVFNMEDYLSNMDNYGNNANFQVAFDFLFNTIKRGNSMVIFISDFLHNIPELEKNLRLLSIKCEVIAIAVRDPMDLELPDTKDLLVLSNPKNDSTMVIDPRLSREAYRKISKEQTEKIRNSFKDTAIDLLELETDKPFVIPIVNFIQERSKGGEHGTID